MKLFDYLIFCMLLFFTSCDLLYPPAYYSSLVSTANGTASSGGGSSSGGTGSVTMYVVGKDAGALLGLWRVDTNSVSYINAGSGNGGRPFLSNDTVFIPGNDGSSGCYWTITTNFDMPNKIPVSGTINLNALQIDKNGVIWTSVHATGDYAAIYSNNMQTWINSSPYVSLGGIQFADNITYLSFAGDSYLWMVSNDVEVNVEYVAGRAGGLLVTNGVIYAAMQDDNNGYQCLYISSNQGTSWAKNIISTGNLMMDVGNGIAYDAGTVYLSGTSAPGASPCYWAVHADGGIFQVILDPGPGIVNDIQICDGVVYTVGMANAIACYWIGTNEYSLPYAVSVSGFLLIKN